MQKIWLAGIGLVAFAVYGCSPSKQTAATVDGHAISQEALEQRIITSPAARNALQTMILEQIILDEATRQKIKITDEDINRYLAYRRDRMPPGRFEELNTQNGMPEVVRRADARAELALRALALKDVKVSDESIQKAYKEDANHLYVKPDWKQVGLIVTKDKADADKAVESLKKGAEFATVAKEFSIPATQAQAERLQWFGVLDKTLINEQGQPLDSKPIVDAITKTAAGQVAAPISMPGAPEGAEAAPERLVIYVKSETKGGKFPLEEVANEIRWRLANENTEINPSLVKDLVKKAKVEVKMDPFKDLEKADTLLPPQPMAGPPPGMAPPG